MMKQKINLVLSILVGNILLAFAVCAFVVPQDFMLGGSTGIGLFLQNWLPLQLSQLSAITNGLLFLLGLIFMGKQFAAASLLSTFFYPIIMGIFEQLPIGTLFAEEDPLLCAIFCACIMGFGVGIVLRAGGSTGGMDIPPSILQKYKGIPAGTSIMVFDILILAAQVSINGLGGILHSILITMICSFVINHTIISGEKKVEIIIISPNYDRIRQSILEQMDCGVTLLAMETGYELKAQKALLSVVYAKKYPALRDMVLKLDPQAFIVASDVKNVNGKGYTLSRV